MFGVMKGAPRQLYCGACKTMGRRYGQKSRMLLNHDTVFLAELLAHLSPISEWSAAYKSFNCLRMPKAEDVPVALDFAAAAAIVLAHFRVADHAHDSPRRHWRALLRLISPAYRKADSQLRAWDFPMDELAGILNTQAEREAHPKSLADVAEPTALATALFFAHGSRLIGRHDAAESMREAGHAFGTLIYTLDGYEDQTKDARTGNFNPFAQFPHLFARAEVLTRLDDAEMKLPPEFAARLRARVEERLGLRPRVLHARCQAGLRQRWRAAVAFGRSMRDREAAGAFVFITAVVLAFLAPHHVRGAESWRHSLGLGLNLMALGAIFASVPNAPSPPPHTPGKAGGISSWFSCCGDGCGDGCCDSCDCCDSCNCCDGCDCS